MKYVVSVVLSFLLASASVWAGPQASGTSSTSKSVANLDQRVAKNQADVERLQQNVGQQESASREAAERLQQQDRTIAQLRQQLKAAPEASKAPAAGH
jgi:septal ring factor EnvC (AmiA/AmiB activator)